MRYDLDELTAWTAAVLQRCGLAQEPARTAAALLVRSEVRGYASHGLARLPTYVERFASGEFNARPVIRHRAMPGGIMVDADKAMGHVVGAHAIDLATRALADSASVLVTVRDCGHFGALGVYALATAEAGLISVLGQGGPAVMGLEGFTGKAMGSNPLAFGCPIPGQAPLVFDMSSSVAARGRVLLALREQRPIPAGWAVDAQGRPTTDPQSALDGALLPAGGYKGMGIAMLVHCISAGLASSARTLDDFSGPVPDKGGPGGMSAFMWFVRPDAFTSPDEFARQMRGWTAHYSSRGPAARLPGSRGDRLEARARAQGVALEGAVLDALRVLGDQLGLALPRSAS